MIKLTVEDKDARRAILKIKDAAGAPIKLLKRVHAHQQSVSGLMFRHLKHGGTRRGVTWAGYKNQYVRKTDGVTVPAEGGVPRADGTGLVQGRLRPSGARVDEKSNLLRDTGLLANAVASVRRIRRGGRALELITPVKYAGYQQSRRPFSFFTAGDLKLYAQWAAEELASDG